MTSEIRANTLKNRVGLGTVSFTDTGPVVSGIVTANSFSGPISGTTGTFSGNVDINGDIDVDGHTNLDNVSIAGVATATTFVGALTGTASGNPTLTSGSNNRVVTATGANALTGEANLTFDGTNMLVNGTMLNAVQLKFGNSGLAYIDHNIVGQDIQFRVGNSSALDTSALRIHSDGKIGIGFDGTPDGLLEVYNSSTAGNTVLKIHNDKTGDAANITLEGKRTSDNDTGQVLFKNNNYSVAGIFANAGGSGNHDGGYLKFFTSAVGSGNAVTERLRIDDAGDIKFGLQSGSSAPNSSTQIRHFDFGRDHWNGTAGDYRALRLKVYNYGNDDVYGLGISASTLEIQSQHSIGFFTGSAGSGTGRRNLRATLNNFGLLTFTNGVKLKLNAASAPSELALLNIGYDGGTNVETRAIDIDGGWSGGENKSISFTHGPNATQLVGQINSVHNGPGSSLRWGKLYHSGDSSTYTMTLDSTSSTTADLNLQGRFRSSKHPAFSVSATSGQSNIGTTATKIQYSTHSTHGYLYDGFDTTNNRFVAPVDGVYTFYVRHWFVPSHTGSLQILLYRNGSQIKESRYSSGSTNPEYNTVQLTSTLFLSATNYIEVYGVTYSGSTTNVFHVSSGSFHTEFSGYLVC